MPREVTQPRTLMDNQDPGTGNELILWASPILERLGWVDKSFLGEKSVWAVLVLLTWVCWGEPGLGGCSMGGDERSWEPPSKGPNESGHEKQRKVSEECKHQGGRGII